MPNPQPPPYGESRSGVPCYICGQGCGSRRFRRDVYIGSDRRISVGRTVRVSQGQRTGVRTVCEACARRIDDQPSGLSSIVAVGAVVLLVVLFLLAAVAGRS